MGGRCRQRPRLYATSPFWKNPGTLSLPATRKVFPCQPYQGSNTSPSAVLHTPLTSRPTAAPGTGHHCRGVSQGARARGRPGSFSIVVVSEREIRTRDIGRDKSSMRISPGLQCSVPGSHKKVKTSGSQFPALTWQLTAICNSSSRDSDALFWPLWALYTPNTHI
jgi:hypothetical protein